MRRYMLFSQSCLNKTRANPLKSTVIQYFLSYLGAFTYYGTGRQLKYTAGFFAVKEMAGASALSVSTVVAEVKRGAQISFGTQKILRYSEL